MKEDGGALSIVALSAALLFVLGVTTGAAELATEIVSLLLCPGTPSNVDLFSMLCLLFTGATGFSCLIPNLNAAAFVILGANAGGAVDATEIVLDLLCPGTSMKICFISSFVGMDLLESVRSSLIPWRSAAAFVMRGAISGLAWVAGSARAEKRIFCLSELNLLLL